MEQFEQLRKGYELIVRKRVSSFLEKLLRCCGYDFRHDIYKQIVYGEIPYNTPFEEKVKNYYDAFQYLLANRKNPLTKDLLTKFFTLFNQTNVDPYFCLRITSYMYYMDGDDLSKRVVDFHMTIYKELYSFQEDERVIVSWMFVNYYLVRNDIPCIQLLRADYCKYIDARDEYLKENKQKLYELMIEVIKKCKYQTIEFKQQQCFISTDDLIKEILKDEAILKEKYKIKKIYIFGSFAKELARIDSDIDLMIMFSEELVYEEKLEMISQLSSYYEEKFHRYIDISEISTYLTDDFLKEHTRIIKVY